MAGLTIEQAQSQLQMYMDAELAILSGQSYEINGRKLTRANLADVQKGVGVWNNRILGLTSTSSFVRRSRVIVPGG